MFTLKNLLYFISATLFVIFVLIITPTSHRYILSAITNKFLILEVTYKTPHIGFNTYNVEASMENNSTLHLHIDYSDLFKYKITADFHGDTAIFSDDAKVELPSIILDAQAQLYYNKRLNVQAKADDIEASLETNIYNFDYTLEAQLKSLSSVYKVLDIEDKTEGLIDITSEGNLLSTYNAHITSKEFKVYKEIAQLLEADFSDDSLHVDFDISASFKDNKVKGKVGLYSSLLDFSTNHFSLDINKSTLDVETLLRLKTTLNNGDLVIKAKGDFNKRVEATLFAEKFSLDKKIAQLLDKKFTKSRLFLNLDAKLSIKHKNLVDASLNLSSDLIDVSSDLVHINIANKRIDSSAELMFKTSDVKGELSLSAKGDYTKGLDVTTHADNLHVAQHIVQNIDANFSKKTLAVAVDTSTHYADKRAKSDITLKSNLLSLFSKDLHVDLTTKKVDADVEILTDLYAGDTNISTTIVYNNPIKLQAIINTRYETLTLNDVKIDTQKSAFSTQYLLNLRQSNPTYRYLHNAGKVEGFIKKDENLEFTLHTNSFGKELDIKGTQKDIVVSAKDIDIVSLLKLYKPVDNLKKATLNANLFATHPNFLDFNISTLHVQSDINISDVLLHGFDLDLQLDNLKNYQNISILNGNFPGKGLLKATVRSTTSLVVEEDIVSTEIPVVYLDTTLHNSTLTCNDCALTTNENLVAIHGGIEVKSEQFLDVEIGILRKNRCAFFTQGVYGTLSEPSFKLAKSSAKLVGGVVTSLGTLVKDTAQAVTFTDDYLQCTPFYTGVIQFPQ